MKVSEHDEHAHDHDHDGHRHEGHDHDHDHDHDHVLIVDRLPAGDWTVDPEGSEVNFKARALFGVLPVNGYFGEFSGDLTVDAAGAVNGSLVVQTATIETGIAKRDADLRSAAYLGVADYPQLTFTAQKLEASGEDHLNLTGSLEVHGTTIPLSFPVYAILHGDHLHIEGRVKIDHQAAGLKWAKPGMVGKTVRADVALTLIQA